MVVYTYNALIEPALHVLGMHACITISITITIFISLVSLPHPLHIPYLHLPEIRHAPRNTAQARHIHDLLMPAEQDAHCRSTTLVLRPRSAAHLREARALGREVGSCSFRRRR